MDFITPLPLAPEDRPYQRDLHLALLAELFKHTKVVLIFLMLVLGIIWMLLGPLAENHPLFPWIYLGTAIIVLLRLLSIEWMERRPRCLPDPNHRHAVFIVGSTLVGLAFGLISWTMVPVLDSIELALLGLILVGVHSVAVQSMAGSPLAFTLYMIPNMGTFTVASFLRAPIEHNNLFRTLLIVYILVLMVMCFRFHQSLREGILQGLKLSDLALRDSLTDLRNRRFLQEFMETEVERTQRTWSVNYNGSSLPSSSLALIMLDLDHFKNVNDTYGHEAGDEVLRQFSLILRDAVRKPDLVTRWGGEEFVVVAVDTFRTPKLSLTERIRQAVEAHPFRLPDGHTICQTCSVGYAFFPFLEQDPEGMAWDQVLNLADGALYVAKREGRNRVCGVMPGPALQDSPRALVAVGKDLEGPLNAGLVDLVRGGT
ncbi:MAG: GGDEF domain-containing protein [Acidobacteriota bacterium]|nr:GGDEF domain-containing protein [Acidobacteriota bacterium]